MLGLSPWVSLLAVVLAAAAARVLPPRDAPAIRRILESWWGPAIAGVLTGIVSVWAWGSLRRLPVLHDESAYLLQAQLFASAKWTGVGPPLPEFFEQLYVLVDPVLASKYPPGNSLLLAPGVLMGLPGLPVVLMNAASGALLFALARRLAGCVVAVITFLVWVTCFPAIYYHLSYMSEVATSFTWLLTWWGVLRWRAGDGRRWLVLAGAAAGWCMITRPLTGVALATVAVIVVVRHAAVTRAWRDAVPAAAIGLLICSLLPLWSWRTTGDVRQAPLAVYTRTYVPFDSPGFGVGAAQQPSSRLPHDQWMTSAAFYQEHARHTLDALPRTILDRASTIARDAWYEWRGGLQIFALVGLLALPAEALVILAAFALQFLLYLSYAHPAGWGLYYVEGAPVLALVTAIGIARVMSWVSRGRRLASAGLLALAACVPAVIVARQVRQQVQSDHAYHESFETMVRQIPDPRAIVFVHYGPEHLDGLSLVRNVPDLAAARVWTVYDRGGDNIRLLRLAPDREAYLFDEATWTLRRVQRPNAPTRTSGVAIEPTPVVSASRR